MSLLQEAKKSVIWTFLQQFSVQFINFGVQIILARLLLPSDFGLIAMISIFIVVGQGLSDSGMTSSLIRSEKVDDDDYGTVFVTNFGVSLILYALTYIISPYVADFYNQEVLSSILRIYSLVFIISSFNVVQIAKLTKELNFKRQFTYQLPSVILGAIVGISMAKLNYGVWSIVGLNLAQNIIYSIILWVFYDWRPKFKYAKYKFKYHFDYGYKLTFAGILNNVYLNLYKIIIGKKFSPIAVGYFSQADSLRLFPANQLSIVLNKVTFPLFAKIQNDQERLLKAYKSSVRLVLSFSTALMLILLLCAKPLFLIVFGEKWLPSVPYFQILCLASIFLPFSIYNLNILKIKGRSDLFLRVELIKKLIGIATLVICIPFGINTIVWGLCVTNIIFSYLNGYYSGKFISYKLWTQIFDSLYVVFLGFIPFIMSYFVGKYFLSDLNSYFQLILLAILYAVIYLPIIFFFNKPLLDDIRKIIGIKEDMGEKNQKK